MKTQLVPTAAWPDVTTKRPQRERIRRPRPKTYAKTQPITEVDYLREAREQIAEMKRKKINNDLAVPTTPRPALDI